MTAVVLGDFKKLEYWRLDDVDFAVYAFKAFAEIGCMCTLYGGTL